MSHNLPNDYKNHPVVEELHGLVKRYFDDVDDTKKRWIGILWEKFYKTRLLKYGNELKRFEYDTIEYMDDTDNFLNRIRNL